MKKILFLLVIFINVAIARENYELKLYEKILPAIFKKDNLLVFTDENSKEVLNGSTIFKIIKNCKDAEVLVGRDFSELNSTCLRKPIFATNYRTFNEYNSSFGAFYWRKGRPQIRFKLDALNFYHLYLPETMKKYAK